MALTNTKANRLRQIEALLLEHPEGLSQAEIARRMGVHRSTIFRNLPDLPFLCADERGRLTIDRTSYHIQVRMSLYEATAIHLAARLMATRMDKMNPHAAAALRKLALALEKLAPHISRHIALSADILDDVQKKRDLAYLSILEVLTLAWAEGRQARIWHASPGNEEKEYTLSPYFLEPSAVGQAVYVIGWSDPPGALRTFKLERIARAQLMDDLYTIPDNFDPYALLANAWGIWYTDQPPVEVVLRFSSQVAQRVNETRWHPGEQVDPQPDGSLIWRASIAEPLEMLPWIRGWGSQVKVLEPEGLKQMLKKEAQRLAEMYE